MTAPSRYKIGPEIDIYGSRARSSALADFIEVAALAGVRITEAALADLIYDNGWGRRPVRQFITPVGEDDPEDMASSVYSLLADRRDQLKGLYPFALKHSSLHSLVSREDCVTSTYVGLLAIAVVHAWGVPTDVDPKPVLESVTALALAAAGIETYDIGATERGSGFDDALSRAATKLGLRRVTQIFGSRHAQDAGVDTLGSFCWRDSRPAGRWLLIGQATVGKSDTWARKLSEPSPARWAKLLVEPLHPQTFLSVPHHVETEHLRDLLVDARGVVVDRLRLTPLIAANSADQMVLVRKMIDCEIDL